MMSPAIPLHLPVQHYRNAALSPSHYQGEHKCAHRHCSSTRLLYVLPKQGVKQIVRSFEAVQQSSYCHLTIGFMLDNPGAGFGASSTKD